MTQNLFLSRDDVRSIGINPAKTIFWIGAGVGANAPCCLPLGNELTDTYLESALGEDLAKRFILYWNNHVPRIRECVKDGDWHSISAAETYTLDDVRSGRAWDRPRLEFIIGEINKLDLEFQDVEFQKPENRKRYSRRLSIDAIRHFAEAEPNLLHYWLADFARAGATIVTANFDVCIEKALMGDALPAAESREGVRGIETGFGFIYHFHGIATDENIQRNLGATVNTISKRLPKEFTDNLKEKFKSGYDIVFVGYSGLDFFDVRPFFEELDGSGYPGKAMYLHYCSDDRACDRAAAKTKQYQYLLEPFSEKKIVYGDSAEFFAALGRNSGVVSTGPAVSGGTGKETAFAQTKRELEGITSGMTDEDREVYHFLNAFRIASQLNINLVNFYPDWGERIRAVYFDWKNDAADAGTLRKMFKTSKQISDSIVEDIRYNNWGSKNAEYLEALRDIAPLLSQWSGAHGTQLTKYLTWKRKGAPDALLNSYVDRTCEILEQGSFSDRTSEEEDIERDTVHYLCGWQAKRLYVLWAIPVIRYSAYPRLRRFLAHINRLLEHPFTSLRYRTFYLSLCRQRDAIHAMLGDKKKEKNGYYGNVQQEWNICMEIPDFYDARMVIRARILQFWIMICKMQFAGIGKYRELKRIYADLNKMRSDDPE